MTEAPLDWYVYWSEKDSEANRLKTEYQKKIEHYLEVHPETTKEIADKMRNCRVMVGMTEEQILAMVKPHYVLKGRHRNEKIFKYSNVGKFEWSKFIGEGVKVWISLTNGVVTDIREVDLVIGY